MQELNTDLTQTLFTVIDYMYKEEETHFLENPCSNHIFVDLLKIEAFLKRGKIVITPYLYKALKKVENANFYLQHTKDKYDNYYFILKQF
jgi:sucrose-6-phosphate hydrolase SacC (GH32 family)